MIIDKYNQHLYFTELGTFNITKLFYKMYINTYYNTRNGVKYLSTYIKLFFMCKIGLRKYSRTYIIISL